MSAVDSIIVLFAEAPQEFNANHPELAREVEEAWAQAWPSIFSPAAPAPAAMPIITATTVDPTDTIRFNNIV
jgi:hypothetical protein